MRSDIRKILVLTIVYVLKTGSAEQKGEGVFVGKPDQL